MPVNVSLKVDSSALLTGRTGAVSRVMAGFAGLVTTAVRATANERVQRRTGRYLAGISSTWDGTKITTRATAPYSGILEGGSRPHVIRPIPPNRFLRFPVAGGRIVYARSVNHPGTQPYHILRDGVRRAGRERFGG